VVQGGETWGFGRLWRLLGRCIFGEDRRAPRDHPRAGQLRFLGSVVVVRIVVGSAFALVVGFLYGDVLIAWNVIKVLRLDVVLVAGILGTVLRLEVVIVAGIVPCLVVVMGVIIKFCRASFLALCRLEGNIVV